MKIAVALPRDTVEISAVLEGPADPWAAIVLAHGAGSGMEHPFLVGLAGALNGAGIATLRFTFPYREAGRRLPGPAAHAIATWRAVRDRAADLVDAPLWAAGKSYGGRMASMAAAEDGFAVKGLVYLGYPFHPPGQPEKTRGVHLAAIQEPQLFLSGADDPFIQPRADFERVVAGCPAGHLHELPGAGHSFEVKGARRPADEIGASLAPVLTDFVRARS
ncbi:alpha/beta family hydrolase [Microbacterium sp. NPDC078428]|uniref:alpha/beta hydrolase family protein n=1 Tax=Microbacterium sp. NPDC078428 TaxID=3364190 RepID=UPI0037C682C0